MENKSTENETVEPNQNQPEELKQIPVVNDEMDFELFIHKLDVIAEKCIPVALNPNLNSEIVFGRIRQENYFAQITYDPNSMTHMIVKVMPQMVSITDSNSMLMDTFNQGNVKDMEKLFEYPEKK